MPIKDQQLTANFSLHEFLVSETYPKIAAELDPTAYQIDCLRLLSESIMQSTRDYWGPLTIESGFRDERLNLLVRGQEDSDHLLAAAVDFSCEKCLSRVYLWIKWSHLPYRQLIWYKNKHFIHVSINTPGKGFKNEAWKEGGLS